MIRRWTHFSTARWVRSPPRSGVLAMYYLLILLGLIYLYGSGDFTAPAFVYQGF